MHPQATPILTCAAIHLCPATRTCMRRHILTCAARSWAPPRSRRMQESAQRQTVVNNIQTDEERETTQRDVDGSGGDVSDTRTQSWERSEVPGPRT